MSERNDSQFLRLLWWNLAAPNRIRAARQIEHILALRPRPDVIGLCEVTEDVGEFLKERLTEYRVFVPRGDLQAKQRRVALATRLDARELPTDRFRIPSRHPTPEARGFRVRPQAVISMEIALAGRGLEIHAAHIPNGSSNGWAKMDHLWALRYGLEGRQAAQILCGDFNTPQAESGRTIITFGQNRDGTMASHTVTRPPFSEERPWDGPGCDAGERAVLEGLPRDLGMPDVFRKTHPRARGFTWAPHGREDLGRRFDHVFASRDLDPARCRHIEGWRKKGISDHCPVDVTFRLSGPSLS